MRFRRTRWSVAAVAALVLAVTAAAGAGVARAEVPKKLQRAFRGKILITDQELPGNAGTIKETIRLYRKKSQRAVDHTVSNGVATWDFHFLVFMKRQPRSRQVSLDFYTAGKKQFVANKRFTGVDPKLKLLKGDIQISEDDGLKRGTDYIVKLSANVGGREVILAVTRLKAK